VGEGALGEDEFNFENLVSAHEIAERLGWKRVQSVHGWLHTDGGGFPKPVRRIGRSQGAYIWYWPDVEDWARSRYPERLERRRHTPAEQAEPVLGPPPLGLSAELIETSTQEG